MYEKRKEPKTIVGSCKKLTRKQIEGLADLAMESQK